MKKAALALLCASSILLSGCDQWFALPTPIIAMQPPAPSRTAAASTHALISSPRPSPSLVLSASPAFSSTPTPPLTSTVISPTPSLTPASSASAAPTVVSTVLPTSASTIDPSGGESCFVRCDKPLAVRGAPDSKAKVIGSIGKGEKVLVTGFEGPYAHIRDVKGEEGYMLCGNLVPEKADPWLAGLDTVKPVEIYSYDRMMQDLKSLAAQYPGRLQLESAGKTLQGRDIPVAVLGDPNAPRQVLVQGSIHARENMTAMLILAQIEYCLKYGDAPAGSGTLSKSLAGVCFRILPMTNPDGVTISQTATATDALKAIYSQDKKRKYTGLPLEEYLRAWKANAAGVDLNRNFPAAWEALTSSDGPSSSRYKGASPGNQPESRALMEYTQKYRFDATISYHATGSNIYWQYGDAEPVNSLSNDLALAVRSCTQYALLNSEGLDSGGYKDWVMGALGIPSLTIEIGSQDCPLPLDEFNTVWARNRNVPAAVAEWVKGKTYVD